MCDDDVLVRAEAFALQHAATPDQRRLFEVAFDSARELARAHGASPDDADCVYVPRWVYAAVRGDCASPEPLTAATFILWLSVDLLDALMDGDPLPGWRGHAPTEISLAAMTLGSAMAPLALTLLDAPPEIIAAMQQTLFQGLLRMSAGQLRDVRMAGHAEPAIAEVEAAVMGKSGEALAMLAALAAQFAGADVEQVAAFAEMGRALGTARQLQSDCQDVLAGEHSKDLASGTRTLPIAWRLEGLAEDERSRFLALLDEARTEQAARDAVCATLAETGAFAGSAFVIEVYCDRARQALARAGPRGPAIAALQRRIDGSSLFGDTTRQEVHEDGC